MEFHGSSMEVPWNSMVDDQAVLHLYLVKSRFLFSRRQVLGEVPSREIWLQFVNVAENKIFCAAHTYLCAQVIPIRDRRGTPNRARCDRHLTFVNGWTRGQEVGATGWGRDQVTRAQIRQEC